MAGVDRLGNINQTTSVNEWTTLAASKLVPVLIDYQFFPSKRRRSRPQSLTSCLGVRANRNAVSQLLIIGPQETPKIAPCVREVGPPAESN